MSEIPALLTATEVAKRMRVEPSTVYRWCSTGVLPCVRVGGTVRVPAAELAAQLERGTHPATGEGA